MLFERPFLKKIGWMRFIPSALIIVILGILTNNLFEVYFPHWVLDNEHLVTLPVAQGIDDFVGFFTFPDFTQFGNPQVYIIAGTLALVASLETLLSVEATDKIDPLKRTTKTNRELKAQGIGNIVSGLIGGLPITQVVVRSSANIDAGGKSKKATIIHAAFLFFAVLLIAPILNQIPMSALGVVLLVVGYKLSKIGLYTNMYKLGWTQFIPFLVTVVAILFTDLLVGIGIGMVVAIYFILKNNYKFAYKLKKDIVDGKTVVRLSLSEEVTFLNKGSIQLTLDGVEPNSHVIIDGSNSGVIDYDVLEIIHNFKTFKAPSENISVETINVPAYVAAGGH
jgi:carbonic anhydrase